MRRDVLETLTLPANASVTVKPAAPAQRFVLRGEWNHASMWDRARLSLHWWQTWIGTVSSAAPGSLWQCPWLSKPKALKTF